MVSKRKVLLLAHRSLALMRAAVSMQPRLLSFLTLVRPRQARTTTIVLSDGHQPRHTAGCRSMVAVGRRESRRPSVGVCSILPVLASAAHHLARLIALRPRPAFGRQHSPRPARSPRTHLLSQGPLAVTDRSRAGRRSAATPRPTCRLASGTRPARSGVVFAGNSRARLPHRQEEQPAPPSYDGDMKVLVLPVQVRAGPWCLVRRRMSGSSKKKKSAAAVRSLTPSFCLP